MGQVERLPLHITTVETSYSSYLSLALRRAFDMALEGRSNLSEAMFEVPGFSGRKFRMFLNNLLATIVSPRYLEIGVFNGGSFVPAIYNNRVQAAAVDNWSWPDSNLTLFKSYVEKYGAQSHIDIIDKDFREVDYQSYGPFNVMFYDGAHGEQDQLDGVRLPAQALDESCIVIVDDWNWEHVRTGTFAGLRSARCQIAYSIEIRTTLRNDGESLPEVCGQSSDWHNGMLAAVVTRHGE